MGYTITAPVKSVQARDRMMKFLKLHYNHKLDENARGPIDRDFAYDKGKCRIGFDATMTSPYIISVCAWIALKIGKRKVFPTKETPKAAGPCKFLRYDGHEDWPLLIRSKYQEGHPAYLQIDWVGCIIERPQLWDRLVGKPKKMLKIHEELKRLDDLWHSDKWQTHRSFFA